MIRNTKFKPRLFIGSSSEDIAIAEAIHHNLDDYAECSLWNQGVFAIGSTAMNDLLVRLRSSDFGIFVCSPSDVAQMRGKPVSIVRDNVLLELGMFLGFLGPDRTFFLVPKETDDLHLPTDLNGITSNRYNSNRMDNDWRQATGPFCSEVRSKITERGYLHGAAQQGLDYLIVQYASTEWVPDWGPESKVVGRKRWQIKEDIFNLMVNFCTNNRINKDLLCNRPVANHLPLKPEWNYTSHKIALIAAIKANPEAADVARMTTVPLEHLTDGKPRLQTLETAKFLLENVMINKADSVLLKQWAENPLFYDEWVGKCQKALLDTLKQHLNA